LASQRNILDYLPNEGALAGLYNCHHIQEIENPSNASTERESKATNLRKANYSNQSQTRRKQQLTTNNY